MRSRLRTLCVAFCLFTLSTEKSYAQIFCVDDQADFYTRGLPGTPLCLIGQMPDGSQRCHALGDEKVGDGLNRYGRKWYNAVKRGVEASSWNVDSVWTTITGDTVIAELNEWPEFDQHGFKVVRLCPDERTGELAAIVTITPSQLMLLGWRIRNGIQHIAADSPYYRDLNDFPMTHMYGFREVVEADALAELSGLYESRLTYMAGFEFPYRKAFLRPPLQSHVNNSIQASKRIHKKVEKKLSRCHKALRPLLERVIALSLQTKGGVVPIASVVLANHAELDALVPDCIPVVYPDEKIDPVRAYGTIGPSDIPCPRWTACFALDDRDAIARLNDQGFDHGKIWVDAIRRGVDVSAWDASRVWVHVTSLFWPSFEPMPLPPKDLQSDAFKPIRHVRRGRDGAPIAVVTITPAQLLHLGWVSLRRTMNFRSASPSHYPPLWLDRGEVSRFYWALRTNNSRDYDFEIQQLPPHVAYLENYFYPYGRGQALKARYPSIEDAIVRCPAAHLPFLERFVALSLARPGTVVPADSVLSDERRSLMWLQPKCALPKLWESMSTSDAGPSTPESLLQSIKEQFQ